jgi:hypothetical protein
VTNSILWVGYPRSYTPGRNKRIKFITHHYTAGSEGQSSAENGAQYDKTRADGTSTHYFTDSLGPALQEVPDGDRAHTARQHGNDVGIHIEICGTRQTRAQWLDGTSLATLQTTAWLCATLLKRHSLAFHRLTVAETRDAYYDNVNGPTGINDHYDCTLAFPEDQGTHNDVGVDFPWDVYLPMVGDQLAILNGGGSMPMPKTFVLNQTLGTIPAGALFASGGSGFFHIHDPDDAVFYGQTWGIDPFNTGAAMTLEDAHRRFGPFLGEYNQLATTPGPAGPAGPPGPAGADGEDGVDGEDGSAFAHTHDIPAAVTGPADTA